MAEPVWYILIWIPKITAWSEIYVSHIKKKEKFDDFNIYDISKCRYYICNTR